MFLAHRLSALIVATSGLAALMTTNDAGPEAQCQVRGVWELMSVSQDGKDQPLVNQYATRDYARLSAIRRAARPRPHADMGQRPPSYR